MHITTTRRRVLLFASSFLALFTRGAGSHNTGAEQETAAVLNKHMNWMGDAFVPAAMSATFNIGVKPLASITEAE